MPNRALFPCLATGLLDTRFWKTGQPANFSDIQVGDKLRTKTHGIGRGKAWPG